LDGRYVRQDIFDYSFSPERVSKPERIEVCPVIFAPNQYRYVAEIYQITPPRSSP
jgi:hypothetical protein